MFHARFAKQIYKQKVIPLNEDYIFLNLLLNVTQTDLSRSNYMSVLPYMAYKYISYLIDSLHYSVSRLYITTVAVFSTDECTIYKAILSLVPPMTIDDTEQKSSASGFCS